MSASSEKLTPRHDRFCQGIADGLPGADAYLWAGYNSSAKAAAVSANRLLKNAKIVARIEQLLKVRLEIDQKATEKAIEKLAITKERVLAELARIGFSDIRKAVRWRGALIQEQDTPEGGDTLVVRNIYSNHVELVSSDDLDADTAASISEVSQSPTGGLKIKLYDKKAALVDLGRHLGLFGPKGTADDPINLSTTVADEFTRRITGLSERVRANGASGKPH